MDHHLDEWFKPSCIDNPTTLVGSDGDIVAVGPLAYIIDDQTGEWIFNVLGNGFREDDVAEVDHDEQIIRLR